MKLKKAAMFGLDARIALAIFGALSVISGAALYSAIQQSRTVAVYQQLTEIHKASEAYYLDTGTPLYNMSNHSYELNIGALLTNEQSAAGWSGPYVSHKPSSSKVIFANFLGVDMPVYMYRNAADDWSATLATVPIRCNAATKGCYEWTMVHGYNADLAPIVSDLFTRLDEQYDAGDGAAAGNIRYRENSSIDKRILVKGLLRGQKDEI